MANGPVHDSFSEYVEDLISPYIFLDNFEHQIWATYILTSNYSLSINDFSAPTKSLALFASPNPSPSFADIDGGPGDDVIDGTPNNDTLRGFGGNDTLNGLGGNDVLEGGDDNDTLNGGIGNDRLEGGSGDDILTGGDGQDFILAGAGNDTIIAGPGDDQTFGMYGEDGDDTFVFTDDMGTQNFVVGGAGFDTIDVTGLSLNATGDDYLNLWSWTASDFDQYLGGAGPDVVQGNFTGAQIYHMGAGNDYIEASEGADTNDGGDDTDTISYFFSTGAVSINLATGAASGGYAAGDTLMDLENVYGSELSDVLTGTDGVNIILGNGGADQLNGGDGDDFLYGNEGFLTNIGPDVIDGGAGFDYATYGFSDQSVTINLTNTNLNTGEAAGDTYFNIEAYEGSQGDDFFIGAGANDFVSGALGNDHLTGNGGNDTLFGAGGDDIIFGNAGSDSLGGGDGNDTMYGGNGNDMVSADAGNDILFGNSGDDGLGGGDGDDILNGGTGADSLDGAAGNDTVTYETSSAGVTANLDTATYNGGDATGDTLGSIENLIGSNFADTLTGDDNDNILDGGGGVDTLNGGDGDDVISTGFKADIADGGAGIDTVDYSLSDFSQIINLTSNVNVNGHANGDQLSNFENVLGSATRKDDVTGNLLDNVLDGQGGNDVLRGGKGDDTLIGGVGNDSLFGGKGADVHDGGDGRDWVKYNGSSALVDVDLVTGGTAGIALGDTFIAIENVRGTDFGDTILANGLDNKIIAGKGDDIVEGRGGKDALQGNDGNDTIAGGAGKDTMRGQAGDDTFIYATGDGVDKVLDFDDNGDDQIDLSDFGFASFADVQAIMFQVGSRVNIDFGGGDVLRLENTNLADMGADDFILTGGAAEAPDDKPLIAEVLDASDLQQDLIAAFTADAAIQSPIYQTKSDGILEIMTDDDFGYNWDGFVV